MGKLSLQEIQSNEELRRHEFPVVRNSAFLAHAGVCPLPRRVTAAMEDYIKRCTQGDQEAQLRSGEFLRVRELSAQLIGARVEEVALVGPTSLALSFVAAGLKFRKGDNVLVYFEDYPSNVYPWMALARQGVEVRMMNIREFGRVRALDVIGQVDERTRLVALASSHFISGFRPEIDLIGRELRARRILFCLDAIQTLGVFDTQAEHVDFMAADAHKWLLGPCGAGLFYVRQSVQEKLEPIVHGWHNVRCPNFVAQESIEFLPDARRYEAGTANFTGLIGMGAGIELLLEIGLENISRDLWRKRLWVTAALQEKGFTVLQANNPPETSSGIITFFKPGADMPQIHGRLTEHQVATSLRTDRSGQRYIRLSPHFYNTDAELQRVVELV